MSSVEEIAKRLKTIPSATLRKIADDMDRTDERVRREVEREARRREARIAAYREESERINRTIRISRAVRTVRAWHYEGAYELTAREKRERRNAKVRETELSAQLAEARHAVQLARIHEEWKVEGLERKVAIFEEQLEQHRAHNPERQIQPPSRHEHYERFVRNHPPTILDEFVAKLLGTTVEDLPEGARVITVDTERGTVKTLDGREFVVLPKNFEVSRTGARAPVTASEFF